MIKRRILVMMSTYNGEKHLREQVDRILRQKTNHEVHLRIRDDGSKDSTCEIIEKYVSKYPGVIEFERGENLGYNASFFKLIQTAEGYDYYSISDQDDVWLDDKLQIACDAIDEIRDTPVLYASTSFLVHDDMIPYGTTRKKERAMTMYNTIIQNICPGHTQVMNNKLLDLIKGDVDTSRLYVYDSWIQNVANLYGVIVFDNKPHTYYRQHFGNQLGSGTGGVGQLIASIRRDKTGDGQKYRRQIEYFVEKNRDKLKIAGYLDEIEKLLLSRSLLRRFIYCITGKTFRQKRIETIAFRCAVLAGKF